MAQVTPAQYKAMILAEMGEQDNVTGPVSQNIDALWQIASNRIGTADLYQVYLQVKLKAIDLTIGSVWRGEVRRVGPLQKDTLDDKTTLLRQLRQQTVDEIEGGFGSFRLNFDIFEPEQRY